MVDTSKNLVFWAILVVFVGIPFALLVTFATPRLVGAALPWIAEKVLVNLPEERRKELYRHLVRDADLLGPELVEHTMRGLSEEDKKAVYDRIAAGIASWHDVLPEPDVGRIAKRNHTFEFRGAEVVTNNVGFRSRRPFSRKRRDTYRIICLGDSMVFGAGGPEEDRFCGQIEQYYRDAGITVDGKTIETYALGIGSWSMVNEATYLGSRITHYDPDLVLVLTIANDITDTDGVTGTGALTKKFTPEYRDRGTAVFSTMPPGYETGGVTALMTDLSPEGRRRWAKGMKLLKRLEDLQQRRGKHILFSVLHTNAYFTEIYKDYYRRYGFRSPVIFTRYYFDSPDTVLPHDPHPNRQGHAVLANHYINALSKAGILPVASAKLPELYPELSDDYRLPPARGELEHFRNEYLDRHLKTRLDFDNLNASSLKAYLGGFFPVRQKDALHQLPFASVRSGFLLARPDDEGARFELEIDVPKYPELYPFELDISLQGISVNTFRLEDPDQGGRHTIVCDLPPLDPADLAVEVMLETSSYWTTIHDDRMKSFYLVSARWSDG